MSLINLSANFWTISITFFPDGFVAWLDSLIDGMFAEADLAFFLIWLLTHLTQEACESYCRQNNRQHASLNNLTTALVDHLNVGVAQAYLNQKRLDSEAKQLHLNATNFSKQTTAWLQLIDSFNNSLKEVGDVESWAKTIETDMRAISSTLEYAYKVNSEASNSQSPGN